MNLRKLRAVFVVLTLTLTSVAAFADAGNMTVTNSLTVGEVILVKSSGTSVLVALEGVVRVMPAGPGKLAVSGLKAGRTDMVVLDDAGKTTDKYVLIVGEEKAAAAPPPPPPAPKPPRKIKVYEGSQLKEYEVRY